MPPLPFDIHCGNGIALDEDFRSNSSIALPSDIHYGNASLLLTDQQERSWIQQRSRSSLPSAQHW